jgi:hypothetical protein
MNIRMSMTIAAMVAVVGGVMYPAAAQASTIDGGSATAGYSGGDPVAKTLLLANTAQLDSWDANVTATSYKNISISIQMQSNGYYCGPASVRAALTAYGWYVPQGTLATALKTTASKGTYATGMPSVLNSYQSQNGYYDSTGTSSTADLFSRTKTDVNRYSSALIPLIQAGDLPTWAANGYTGRHFIAIYGYGPKTNYMVSYFDPINVSAMYGTRHVAGKYVYQGLKDLTNELVW